MQEFKSPISRLARLFRNGRDSWKEKAVLKTEKAEGVRNKSQRFISLTRELEKPCADC